MNKLIGLVFLVTALCLNLNSKAENCDSVAIANAGGPGLNLTLQPGVVTTVDWDFSDCLYLDGTPVVIQNFQIYVTKQRNKKGFQASLPSNTKITIQAVNLDTNEFYPVYGFSVWAGWVTGARIQLRLLLDASVTKPLDCAVTYSAAFGG